MSNLYAPQKAAQQSAEANTKNAEEMGKLVVVMSDLSRNLEDQHKDNVKSQKYMLAATIVMAIATVIMAIK